VKKLINTLKPISNETSDTQYLQTKRVAPHKKMKPYPEHHTTLGEEVVRRTLLKQPYSELLTRWVTPYAW